jgi:hypothetical protein
MSYKNIEYFSKMIKNAKNLRQKEFRISTDQATLILSEITEILSNNKTDQEKSTKQSAPISFDAGGFK